MPLLRASPCWLELSQAGELYLIWPAPAGYSSAARRKNRCWYAGLSRQVSVFHDSSQRGNELALA